MATETLRPNAAGDVTELLRQNPDEGAHWEKVDEETPDEASTTVENRGDDTQGPATDLYNLQNSGVGAGVINSVTAYIRVMQSEATSYLRLEIKTNGVRYQSDNKQSSAGVWTPYSKAWANNPQTTDPWTWAEINALQSGVMSPGPPVGHSNYCTQVYVVVDYTPPPVVGRSQAHIIG